MDENFFPMTYSEERDNAIEELSDTYLELRQAKKNSSINPNILRAIEICLEYYMYESDFQRWRSQWKA